MNKFNVIYELGEDGWWVASIPEVPGCHTQGKSIEQARARIREALKLFVRDTYKAELLDEIRLPKQAKGLVGKVRRARLKADFEKNNAQKLTGEAVSFLQQDLKLSVRDIGLILGLSHQRIHQLVNG